MNVPFCTWPLADVLTPKPLPASVLVRLCVYVLVVLPFSGDEILQVNGETLQGLTHQQAIQTFKVPWRCHQNQTGNLIRTILDCSVVFVELNPRYCICWIHHNQVASMASSYDPCMLGTKFISLWLPHFCMCIVSHVFFFIFSWTETEERHGDSDNPDTCLRFQPGVYAPQCGHLLQFVYLQQKWDHTPLRVHRWADAEPQSRNCSKKLHHDGGDASKRSAAGVASILDSSLTSCIFFFFFLIPL